jgi:hypothetical protein
MNMLRIFILLLMMASFGCVEKSERLSFTKNDNDPLFNHRTAALLLSDFSSMEDFQQIVDIEYAPSKVLLKYQADKNQVISILRTGVSEGDFTKARDGSFWDRATLGLRTPYAVFNRADIICVEILGRRRHMMFGEGDVAFYDLAERSVEQIREEDRALLSEEALSEKGYLNTFNHITAQALITSLFSERLADFISDVHERQTMPELITGKFDTDQLNDIKNGPVDNYLDMINNEWGQELGKKLNGKFQLHDNTYWTPKLLADYLNEVQNYYSHEFNIGFQPFRETDELIIRFSNKINSVKEDVMTLVDTYY